MNNAFEFKKQINTWLQSELDSDWIQNAEKLTAQIESVADGSNHVLESIYLIIFKAALAELDQESKSRLRRIFSSNMHNPSQTNTIDHLFKAVHKSVTNKARFATDLEEDLKTLSSKDFKETTNQPSSSIDNVKIIGNASDNPKASYLATNLNLLDNSGRSLINMAVEKKDHEMIRLLAHLGANLNQLDDELCETPLMKSLSQDDFETTRVLVGLGADPNHVVDGTTLLTHYVKSKRFNKFEIINLLIELGADVNLANINNATPLLLALAGKDTQTINLLIKSGADINAVCVRGETLLTSSVELKNFEKIELLINLGADVTRSNSLGFTPLDYAKLSGNHKLIKLITKHQEKSKDQLKNEETLPIKTTEVSARSIKLKETSLTEAIVNHDLNRVKHLAVTENHNVNANDHLGITPLLRAVSMNDIEMVKTLVQLGAKVDFAPRGNKFTPLSCALLKNNPEMVKLLVELGADINLCTEKTPSPLLLAIIFNNKEMVRLLAKLGANLNIESPQHPVSPLNAAARGGNIKMLKLLVELGADVNKIDATGYLPLYSLSERRIKKYKEVSAYLKAISPTTAHQRREISLLKGIGHSTEQDNTVNLIPLLSSLMPANLHLTGAHANQWLHRMAKTISILSKEIPNIIPTELGEELQEAFSFSAGVKLHTDEEIVIRIQSDKYTFLATGFSNGYRDLGGHSVTILMKGSHIFICNRGDSSRKPIEVYSFDLKKLHAGIIKQIRNQEKKSDADYRQFFLNDLEKELGLEQSALERIVERNCPFGKQKVGNCSWASLETGIWAFLIWKKIENQNLEKIPTLIETESKRFYSWLIYNQLKLIENYLELPSIPEDSTSTQETKKRRVYQIDFKTVEDGIKNIHLILQRGMEDQDTGFNERLKNLELKIMKARNPTQ